MSKLPNTATTNPFAVLGVDASTSPEAIRKAYFALVRAHPPERDPERFKQIRAAYEQLRDPEQHLEATMLQLRRWHPTGKRMQVPSLDTAIHHADVFTAAAAHAGLYRTDWREHHQKVEL